MAEVLVLAKFHTPLIVRACGENLWELEAPLHYQSDLVPDAVVVPKGFKTDFASVPRVPLAYLAAGGIGEAAAVVHDFLYRTAFLERGMADRVFREAMTVLGVARWRRCLMYWAVRIFAGWAYQR